MGGFAFANNEIYESELTIKDHKFSPDTLIIPKGTKIRLKVFNKDETIEEFESFDLKREKIIPANSFIYIILAPLKPGIYKFFGDFNQDTAQGTIIVKDE